MSFGNNPDAQTNSSTQANNSQRVLDEINSNADDLSQLNPQFKVPDVNKLEIFKLLQIKSTIILAYLIN